MEGLGEMDERVRQPSGYQAIKPGYTATLTSGLGNFSVFCAARLLTHRVEAEKAKDAEQAVLSASPARLST
jgi:hypothetical protein